MAYPFLRTETITGVTGTFEGGSLAFDGTEYVLLDNSATVPRLIFLNDQYAQVRETALPVVTGKDYVGVTYYGNSVIVLREKGFLCADGQICVAELVSVTPTTGQIIDTQELFSYSNITLLGGLAVTPDGLVFIGEFGGRRFYRIDGEDIVALGDISETFTGRASLTYDGEDLIVLNGSGVALGYNERAYSRDTAKDTTLETANDDEVGCDWNGSALVVLEDSPLSLYFYGTDDGGVTPTPSGRVALSDRKQLFVSNNRLESMSIGSLSFDAMFAEVLRRVPVAEGGVIRIEDVSEIRVTPKYLLTGVETGVEIVRDTERLRVRNVLEVGSDYRQSFVCERE